MDSINSINFREILCKVYVVFDGGILVLAGLYRVLFCVTATVCRFRCYTAACLIGGLSELSEYDVRADRK
jgi:hypothetical protein